MMESQDDRVDYMAADSGNRSAGSCSVDRIGLVTGCRDWPIVAKTDHMPSERPDSFGYCIFGTYNPGHLKA